MDPTVILVLRLELSLFGKHHRRPHAEPEALTTAQAVV